MLNTAFRPGSPDWLDLSSPDTRASVDFYTALFGWTFASAGPEAGGYGFFRLDGRTVAALGPLTEEGALPGWTLYFATLDADRTTELVEQAGGTVRFPPFDVFTAGRMAGYTDPSGADFAVWQPHDTRGLDVVDENGSLCWAECHSVDAERAKSFYRTVFGWQEQDVPFEGSLYTVLTPAGGGTDDAHGGIAQLSPERTAAGTGSHWLPYFEVPNPDASLAIASTLGATVRIPATDVHGVGRLAQLTDPHGAAFAVITSAGPGE
ncbi:hydroxylase [Kitasatospora xanthocidica]|uniref:VOC family protein n=1 Tax=Kitasatospora xanthocidica TaxID=83382 RepID=UPI0016719474|nr:VOC family protein [Kitasatospora xanthocidica]GHF52235.1 hydroxylase [Kitasatospora xanthocidica]